MLSSILHYKVKDMANVYKKMIMVLSAVIFAASGYTNEKTTQEKSNCETCCTTCEKDTFPDVCGYNCPANLDIKCGWNFFISGSFLYWQAREHGIDEGIFIETTNVINMITAKSPDFKYHPAFKVAIGGVSDYDKWNFRAQYTRYSAKDIGSFSAPNDQLIGLNANSIQQYFSTLYGDNPFFTTVTSIANQIKLDWKLDLNIADVDMGRTYFVGQKLIFNPFIGIKGGKIDQKGIFTTTYVNSDNTAQTAFDVTEAKIKTWLVGPRFGIDTTWKVGCGFRIFGNAAASLVYQDMKVHLDYTQPVQEFNATLLALKSLNKTAQVTPILECILGLGWGSYFNDNSWRFDLAAGYELQRYFSQQGYLIAFAGKTAPSGDLSLHGLTLTARVDF
jgi:hypothetical protein